MHTITKTVEPESVKRLNALVGRLLNEIASLPKAKQDEAATAALAQCDQALVRGIQTVEPRYAELSEHERQKSNESLFKAMFPGSTPLADSTVDLADDDPLAPVDPDAEKRAAWDQLGREMDGASGR